MLQWCWISLVMPFKISCFGRSCLENLIYVFLTIVHEALSKIMYVGSNLVNLTKAHKFPFLKFCDGGPVSMEILSYGKLAKNKMRGQYAFKIEKTHPSLQNKSHLSPQNRYMYSETVKPVRIS